MSALARRAICVVAACLASPPAFATPTVQLVIVGPGETLASRFGHAALRVTQPGADAVYGYGAADFGGEGMTARYVRGEIAYHGSVAPWARTLARLEEEDRTVERYLLNLELAQVLDLLARVEADVATGTALPYDPFRDNCSTRLRDHLDLVTGGALRAVATMDAPGASFRDDFRAAVAPHPAILLASEFLVGGGMSEPRSTWERMYLPAVLGEVVSRARVRDAEPLAGTPIVVHRRTEPAVGALAWAPWGLAPAVAAIALLVVSGSVGALTPRQRSLLVAAWLAAASSFGLALAVVAAASAWPETRRNWLVVAFAPLDVWLLVPILAVIRGRSVRAGMFARRYLQARAASIAGLVLLGVAFPSVDGPFGPRLVALAGLFLVARGLHPVRASWPGLASRGNSVAWSSPCTRSRASRW